VTLQVIHDARMRMATMVPTAPRNVLKRIVELYRRRVAAHRGARDGILPGRAEHRPPNMPIIPPMGRSGPQGGGQAGLFDEAVDEYGKVIDDIYDFAEAQGFEIDGILQEGGAGQVEINLAMATR
jgi:glutamine synthetase